jgi:hypothetical protein
LVVSSAVAAETRPATRENPASVGIAMAFLVLMAGYFLLPCTGWSSTRPSRSATW